MQGSAKTSQKLKQRNWVHLAMMQAKRCAVHGKTHKQQRTSSKVLLYKEIA